MSGLIYKCARPAFTLVQKGFSPEPQKLICQAECLSKVRMPLTALQSELGLLGFTLLHAGAVTPGRRHARLCIRVAAPQVVEQHGRQVPLPKARQHLQ